MFKQQQGLMNKAVIFLALLALVLSFTARFDIQLTRFFGAVWNLGHVVAFYIWTYLCLKHIKWLNSFSFIKQLIIVAVFSLTFGALIEVAQVQVGRSAEIGDLFSDILGGLLAVSIHSKARKKIELKVLLALKVVLIASILILHKYILFMPINDYDVYQQFPVLFHPSTPFESTRISNDRQHQLVNSKEGPAYVDVQFLTTKYSGIAIDYFPKDWSGYKFLIIDLKNPEQETYRITCRIHDLDHMDGNEEYEDRFNQRFLLKPGFNQIKIAVDKIKHAPSTRPMNLAEVASIGIFTTELETPKKMHLLKIELAN